MFIIVDKNNKIIYNNLFTEDEVIKKVNELEKGTYAVYKLNLVQLISK